MKATITSRENEQITVECENGAQIQLPVFACEGTPEVGKRIMFRAVVLQAQDAGEIDFAKELINEILQGTES